MKVKSDRTPRRIVMCSGIDAADFLDTLLTCTLPAPEKNGYGLLLDKKGRIVCDFFLWRYDQTHFLLDCCTFEADNFARTLLESAIGFTVKISLTDRLQVETSRVRNTATLAWSLPDPRLPEMGWRSILQDTPPVDDPDYTLRRVSLALPEGRHDMPRTEALPLEYGLEKIHAVSFDKGCFLGQEVCTRMHRRQSSKYAVHFFHTTHPPSSDAELISQIHKSPGKILRLYDNRILARIRKECLQDETLGLQSASLSIKLWLSLPSWREG